MTVGNDSDFATAWRDLREKFVRRLARTHLGVDISEMAIRAYDIRKPLADVFSDIRKKNFFESTMYRAGKRIRVILRRNPVKR